MTSRHEQYKRPRAAETEASRAARDARKRVAIEAGITNSQFSQRFGGDPRTEIPRICALFNIKRPRQVTRL